LLPRFFKKIYQTHGGLFYGNNPPYRPSQDLAKIALLCSQCDNTTLGGLESKLKAELESKGFDAQRLNTDPALNRAMVSILWRFVTALYHWPVSERGLTRLHFNPRKPWLEHGAASAASFEFHCEEALKEWAAYVRGETRPVRYPVEFVKHARLQSAMAPAARKTGQPAWPGLINHSDILRLPQGGWLAVVCFQTFGVYSPITPGSLPQAHLKRIVLERIELLHLEVLKLQKTLS
jgi:hypothetical protein